MSNTPNYDAKIKAILDGLAPGERVCEMTGEKWMMDEEEIGWYKKFNVPPVPLSPQARLWSLSVFYMVYQWWWNKHADTGAPVLTSIHPATGIRVLPDKEWFTRDFSTIHLEPSTARPFFEQWRELQLKVPVNASRNVVEPENSIAQFSMGDQNSYFVFSGTSKNSFYLNDCQETDDCMDCNAGINIVECYRVSHSSRLYRCQFVLESYDCFNSSFLFDCRNCEFCFGAANQRNKKYLWWNEQLTKEEWERRRNEVDLGRYDVLRENEQKLYDLINTKAVWPENFNEKTSDSVGEYLIECSDCPYTSFGRGGHHNYWCFGVWNARDNAFSTAVPGDNNFQAGPLNQSANCKFSPFVIRCDDMEYCYSCYDCEHCFGCVGLSRKKFCILNKQYSEEEYWRAVDALKCAMLDRGEYGRPFPAAFSHSYFPDGGPMMYLGATLDDWDKIGFPHFAIDADGAFGELRMEGRSVKKMEEVPESVDDLDDTWAGVPIEDPEIQRPYTLLKPEIAWYKRMRIAPPRAHFTNRMHQLMWMVNMAQFIPTTCSQCGKSLMVAKNNFFQNRKHLCREDYLKYLESH